MGSAFTFDFVGDRGLDTNNRRENCPVTKKPVYFALDTVPIIEGMRFEKILLTNDISLNRRKCVDLKLPDGAISPTESDIIPMEYEGGLKTWECSLDLVRYLHASFPCSQNRINILEVLCIVLFPSLAVDQHYPPFIW
jgi:hypothetical protein